MGTKGDWKRKDQTTKEEQDLRWLYLQGKITLQEFEMEYRKLKKRGLIKRSGRVVK
jgi:hypothetical protein